MRKLSELYQILLTKFYNLPHSGICGRITALCICYNITIAERNALREHFVRGDHKFPIKERRESAFWFNTTEERLDYLKYLIQLCKDQDI